MKRFRLLVLWQYFILGILAMFFKYGQANVGVLTHCLINDHAEDHLNDAPPKLIIAETKELGTKYSLVDPSGTDKISFYPWECNFLHLYGNRIIMDVWSSSDDDDDDDDDNDNDDGNTSTYNYEIFGSFPSDSQAQYFYNTILAGKVENEEFLKARSDFLITSVNKFILDSDHYPDLIAIDSYLSIKTVTIDNTEVKTYAFKGIKLVTNSSTEITFLITPPEDLFLVDMEDTRLVLYLEQKKAWIYVLYFHERFQAEMYRNVIKSDIPSNNYITNVHFIQQLKDLINV